MAPSGSRPTPDAAGEWSAPYDVDIGLVLGPFVHGRLDPTIRLSRANDAWLTMRTPVGPATLRVTTHGRDVESTAWGEGSQWAIDSVPDLLGAQDDDTAFPAEALPERLQPAWRRLHRGWRVPRSRRVMEVLVVAVLEQKVTGVQARQAWSSLLLEHGARPSGPAPEGMRVFPEPSVIAKVPSWQWHRWGVGPQRSATIMRAVRVAGRLEQCVDLDLEGARSRLAAVDGIGPWTVAEVASRALGDADAVSVGDFHLPGHVVYAFTGRMDGTDEDMAQLLVPFSGHRHRVQRLVETSGISRPARGPKMTIADHRAI